MSSLSHLPYGLILDYWFEKLKDDPVLFKFLVTKTIEVFAFRSRGARYRFGNDYASFPASLENSIPANSRLSIVIASCVRTKKDRQDLANLFESIKNQSAKPDEVIVVDDASTIGFDVPSAFKVVRISVNSGPAKARNVGKRIAVGNGSDIIAFTDTDCILSKDWVSVIAQSFVNNRKFHILSGDTSAYDKCWFGAYHNINGTLNGRQFKNDERLLYGTTANLAITRDVASRIDFNEIFPIAAAEDIEFCFKANRSGFAIKYNPEMKVFHNFGYDGHLFAMLNRFIALFRKYGQGEKLLIKVIPDYYSYFERTIEIPAKSVSRLS